jgi:predicted metal-dependent hydrolase
LLADLIYSGLQLSNETNSYQAIENTLGDGDTKVIIKRSSRRKKTIQARMVDGTMEVLAPASISNKALEDHISRLQLRLELRHASRDDANLNERALYLNRKYFNGELVWESVKYSARQDKRRGSCTVSNKTIRISHRLAKMPQWVEDYVIVHELAHLIEPNHGKHFRLLVKRYPLAERAMGFLMAAETLGHN